MRAKPGEHLRCEGNLAPRGRGAAAVIAAISVAACGGGAVFSGKDAAAAGSPENTPSL
jgi:hypothetical protein